MLNTIPAASNQTEKVLKKKPGLGRVGPVLVFQATGFIFSLPDVKSFLNTASKRLPVGRI